MLNWKLGFLLTSVSLTSKANGYVTFYAHLLISMSTDSTQLSVQYNWLGTPHIVELRETKMHWAVQKPAGERKSWIRDCEWQVCELLYESWGAKSLSTWIRHRCAIKRTCASRSGNIKLVTEMKEKKTQSECHVLSSKPNQGMDTRMPRHRVQPLKRTQTTRHRDDGEEPWTANQEIKTYLYR